MVQPNQENWQRIYSDLYPDNTAMRIDSLPRAGVTRLTIINQFGAEVSFMFGKQQAFQAAFALMKSLDVMQHVDVYAPIPPSEVRP